MSREDQNRVFLLLKGDSMEGICILWWALTNFQNEKIKLTIIFIIPPNGNPLPALTESINRTLAERHPKKRTKKSSLKYKAETIMSTSVDFENGVLDLIREHQIKKLAVTSVFSEKLAVANASCKLWFVWYGKVVFIRDASPITVTDEPSTSSKLIGRTPSKKWYQTKHQSSRDMEKMILQQENEDLKQEIDALRHEKSQLELVLSATMNRFDSIQLNYTTKDENGIKIQDLNGRKTSFEVMLEAAMNRLDLVESIYSKMREDRDYAIKESEKLKCEIQQLTNTW